MRVADAPACKPFCSIRSWLPTAAKPSGYGHPLCCRRVFATRTPAVASAPSQSSMQVYESRSLNPEQVRQVLARPRIDFSSILDTVREFGWKTSIGCSLLAWVQSRAGLIVPENQVHEHSS